MAAIRKLRKCAKFVASLFGSRKSKKESVVEEYSTEAIRCLTAVSSPTSDGADQEFEFVTDPDALIKRGCQLVFPVFGRDISEFKFSESDHHDLSRFSSDGEFDYCSWEPDLGKLNDGDRDRPSEESAEAAPEELERCLWKPNHRSELSFCTGPVEMSSFVWDLESKDHDKPAADDQKVSTAKVEAVCSLKQETKNNVSNLLASFNCFSMGEYVAAARVAASPGSYATVDR